MPLLTEDPDLASIPLRPRICEALKRANLSLGSEVLEASESELQRRTQLDARDIAELIEAIVSIVHPIESARLPLIEQGVVNKRPRLSTGDPDVLDRVLRGGLPVGIIEIFGRNGTGKTQVALQLCLSAQLPHHCGGLEGGAIYIDTEQKFQFQRLYQISDHMRKRFPAAALDRVGDHVHVMHIRDFDTLHHVLMYQVPVLMSQRPIRLIVIDSIAATLRAEETMLGGGESLPAVEKTRMLDSAISMLKRISDHYGAVVVCINQVSDAVNTSHQASHPADFADRNIHGMLALAGQRQADHIPALGFAWSHMVNARLWLTRDRPMVQGDNPSNDIRLLRVVFGPNMAMSDYCEFSISGEGVQGVAKYSA
ncbi:P-loop containing nucleoside triphosphate hydrolase protein [Polychytrium aggregatum]|uniref:P-loop containing nucleoside triphosphate hydrolase protein n=1 Tax=Polychytrium aggregatum TaxID=110093 RepID=UPI0022FE4248|nr:P-loop containing nucleoside triphosphate hydrolase protein [Polychytrium aggregatum]KAI9204175.1 P-loop containing nucleoside triphosphate hydrolase protein [Polychytrium aggregatum]